MRGTDVGKEQGTKKKQYSKTSSFQPQLRFQNNVGVRDADTLCALNNQVQTWKQLLKHMLIRGPSRTDLQQGA